MKYHVVVKRDPESGWYVAEVPVLPGCLTQGKTVEEAMRNIKEAIQAYIESLRAHNEPIPKEELVKVVTI